MNHPDWSQEQQRCLDFAGREFIASASGHLYYWKAESWIGARNDDQRPFLMCRPLRPHPENTLKGHLRRMVPFHAQDLPEKPL
jgi:hypothetical protein